MILKLPLKIHPLNNLVESNLRDVNKGFLSACKNLKPDALFLACLQYVRFSDWTLNLALISIENEICVRGTQGKWTLNGEQNQCTTSHQDITLIFRRTPYRKWAPRSSKKRTYFSYQKPAQIDAESHKLHSRHAHRHVPGHGTNLFITWARAGWFIGVDSRE